MKNATQVIVKHALTSIKLLNVIDLIVRFLKVACLMGFWGFGGDGR